MDGPKENADPASRDCIDCSVEYEVVFWTSHFGVDKSELMAVIENVGPRVSDVTAAMALRK